MMVGGLLCEQRRHSEATPSMKPRQRRPGAEPIPCSSLSASSFCAAAPFVLPGSAPVQLCHSPPPLVLNNAESGPNEEDAGDEAIAHSGKCLSIGGGAYEYWDCAASLVGRGSYGIVFRGHRLPQRQTVAIKQMWRMNVRPDELEAMKCVRNKNLVELLEVCDEGEDLTYLVMELCDTDLDRHLRCVAPDGRLGAADMRVVVESVANGYHALFRKHIVHRDIKPQNILLLYAAQRRIRCAKITDFGVSRVLADQQMGLCNVAGTLLYMAPEVGANLVTLSEYDHSADVWSIGCLFYQCLTGKVPFDECSLCRLFLHCAGENYNAYDVPPLPPHTHPLLGALIASLLQIDRNRRASPQQLYERVFVQQQKASGVAAS